MLPDQFDAIGSENVVVNREDYTQLVSWALEAHRKLTVLGMTIPDRPTRRLLKDFVDTVPAWFKPHADRFTRNNIA